jgi:hypothetical protein
MPCIPGRKNRKQIIDYDKTLYRQRNKVKNMFANSKTGGVSPRATTDVPIPSSQQSASQLP